MTGDMAPGMAGGMAGGLWSMAEMGLVTSLVAPGLVLLSRLSLWWARVLRPLRLPAIVALVGFVLLHGAITIGMDVRPLSTDASFAAHVLLLAGAVAFWLPVLGDHPRRLDPGARAVYLFVGAPALDLAGVVIVARGDTAGGLAMIVAMLPIGLIAVWLAWSWIASEETAARAVDTGTGAEFRTEFVAEFGAKAPRGMADPSRPGSVRR